MAQGERRAKAVLAAAIALAESVDAVPGSPIATLKEAVAKYKEVLAAKLPEDPMAWTCPHCDAVRPVYGWHYNLGDTGPFAIQWVTAFCNECKNAIGVSVVAFLPKPELAELIKSQLPATGNTGKPS
jgi:hypothetical protein